MDEFTTMNRRAMMRNLGLLLGAASLPALTGCKSFLSGKGALDEAQVKLLSAIADTIIPATDTPGAVAANVPNLLSGMIHDWASEDTRAELIEAIENIGTLSPDGNFAELDVKQRTALLEPYDKAAVQPGPPPIRKMSALEAMVAGPPTANPGYVRLKGLIINLYYNSEIAMTKDIVFEPVPGKFIPSVAISPGTRPFAGLGGPF